MFFKIAWYCWNIVRSERIVITYKKSLRIAFHDIYLDDTPNLKISQLFFSWKIILPYNFKFLWAHYICLGRSWARPAQAHPTLFRLGQTFGLMKMFYPLGVGNWSAMTLRLLAFLVLTKQYIYASVLNEQTQKGFSILFSQHVSVPPCEKHWSEDKRSETWGHPQTHKQCKW